VPTKILWGSSWTSRLDPGANKRPGFCFIPSIRNKACQGITVSADRISLEIGVI
jgi:hypothetical protein